MSATGRWLRAACSSRSVVERLGDRLQIDRAGPSARGRDESRARERVILEQLFFADREQRTAQRRKHRQLVFGPLDRGQRGANRIDFLALVERLAADQQVRHAARFERLDVVARDVVAEMHEAAEQQADVAGDDLSPLGRRPQRSTCSPATAASGRTRRSPAAALVERGLRDLRRTVQALAVRARHRQRDDRRLLGDVVAMLAAAGRSRPAATSRSPVMSCAERGVHEALDRRHAAKRGLQRDRGRAAARAGARQCADRRRRRRGGSDRSTASDRRR